MKLHDSVTQKILADLQAGTAPWRKPWAGGAAKLPLRHNGIPYRGVNVLVLWDAALRAGYTSPTWLTFRQALSEGGNVRKGERGTTVIYRGRQSFLKEDGEEAFTNVLRSYTVFNLDQCDGLDARQKPREELTPEQRLDVAEQFVSSTMAEVVYTAHNAYYRQDLDKIFMPPFAAFDTPHDYYSTLLHELVHWTKHKSRLDRDFGKSRWGDEGYAKEELVAEIGSAFLCAELGLALTPRPDHAQYIAHWLKVLGDDHGLIFVAAAAAQAAADFLLPRNAEGGDEEAAAA